MVGIYKITNPKGKIYIGQSVDLDKRKIYSLLKEFIIPSLEIMTYP